MKISKKIYEDIAKEIIMSCESLIEAVVFELSEAETPEYMKLVKNPEVEYCEDYIQGYQEKMSNRVRTHQEIMADAMRGHAYYGMPIIQEMGEWAEQNRDEFERMVLDNWIYVQFERLNPNALVFFYNIVPEHFDKLDDRIIDYAGHLEELEAIYLLSSNFLDVSSLYEDLLDVSVDELEKEIESES